MASTDPKIRSITGKLVVNMLTEREDDFTLNIAYVANRSIKDLCKLKSKADSKFSASELESAYNVLMEQAKEELYSGSTVKLGFANNSLDVDRAFIRPKAGFNPEKNSVTIRCTPRSEFREDLKNINLIVSGVKENLPTITTVVDVTTQSVNNAKQSHIRDISQLIINNLI